MLIALLIIIPAIILILTIIARLLEGRDEIDLEADEVILAEAYRHWSVIFIRCALIGSVALLFMSFAFYRSIGGTFVQPASNSVFVERGMDVFNYFFLVILGVVLAVRWWLGDQARKKKKRLPRWERWAFWILLGTLALLIVFRFDGGRIFYVDYAQAAGLDLFNALLIGLGIIGLALVVYTYFDLRDDSLVLTNYRVLRREVQEVPIFGPVISFLLRRKIVIREYIQQLVIEDIQQVNVKQESYFEFYLYQFFHLLERFGIRGYQRYGTIVVQSLSFQTLKFEQASAPKTIQQKILNRVQEVNRNDTPDVLLRRTLEEQIWGNRPPPAARRFQHERTQQTAGIFGWLFPPNPEFRNDDKRTIIWRPSWQFISWQMLKAFVALAAVIIAAILLQSYGLLTGPPLYISAVVLIFAALFWAWFIYDTYQHDLYILNVERIIDEDKAPFGPTNRREAELRSIQNVLFEETFFEGLINIGDVIIRTGGAAGGDFTFFHLPEPREAQAQINAYVIEFRRREQEKNRKQTIQALTQYHLLQNSHAELMRPEVIDQIIGKTMQGVAETSSTKMDEEAMRELFELAREEARWSARRELHNLVRRFIRRQSRGRT